MNIILIQRIIIIALLVVILFLIKRIPKRVGALVINKKNPEFDNYLLRVDIPFEDLEKERNASFQVFIDK